MSSNRHHFRQRKNSHDKGFKPSKNKAYSENAPCAHAGKTVEQTRQVTPPCRPMARADVKSKRREKREPACKPGSVESSHSSGMRIAAHLEQPTREPCGPHVAPRGSLPYLVLLQVGFTLPPVLPPARCALTAPFHPCRQVATCLGGLFSVALSVGSRPPGVTWHLALWSPDFPPSHDATATARPTLAPILPQPGQQVFTFPLAGARPGDRAYCAWPR